MLRHLRDLTVLEVAEVLGIGMALACAVLLAGGGVAALQAVPGRGVSATATIEAAPRPDPSTAARAEAQRLLGTVLVPPGSVEAAQAPVPALAMPSLHEGLPGDPTVVTATRWFTVPRPEREAVAYLRAHPPVGLTIQGIGSSTAQNLVNVATLTTYGTDTTDYDAPFVVLGVVPDGVTRSALRVDVQTLVLPQRTAAEEVPDEIAEVDLQAYRSTPDRPVAHAIVTGAAARALVTDLNALPVREPNLGCTADGGLRVQATFSGAGGAVRAVIAPLGCASVDVTVGGAVQTQLLPSATLIAALLHELSLTEAVLAPPR